jgi:perosamine synthetase
MIGLLPVELWDFRLTDLAIGLSAALSAAPQIPTIHIPDLGDCIPSRSARAALVAAIRAIGLPRHARIGVPLYCCPVVLKAITMTGCTPRFMDVEAESYCLSAEDLRAKRSDVDAVIAVHMFGNMCDMTALKEAFGGKPIIEDCAQSIGSRYRGDPSGSFGTVAVFSFRSGKYLSVGEGGALFSRNGQMRSRLSELTSAMPTPRRIEQVLHVAKTYIRSTLRSRPLYGPLGHPIWATYNKKVDSADKSPIVLSRMYRSDLVLAGRRLASLDSVIAAQRANADYYAQELQLDSARLCHEKPGSFYNRLIYPISFPSARHRDIIARYLYRRNVDTGRPYMGIANVAASYYGYTGDCPVSERIADRVLAIPSHHRLTRTDVQRIAKYLNAGWAELAGRGRARRGKEGSAIKA